jgi:hypothetical protein
MSDIIPSPEAQVAGEDTATKGRSTTTKSMKQTVQDAIRLAQKHWEFQHSQSRRRRRPLSPAEAIEREIRARRDTGLICARALQVAGVTFGD